MAAYRTLLIAIAAILLVGCAAERTADTSGQPADDNSDEAKIRASLTELFNRIREGDKTVMYEQEFDYYRQEYSLSQYYEFDRVMQYRYDTLKRIEIDSVKLFGDSATAYVHIIYESEMGGEIRTPYPVRMFRSGDRWIKPSMSNSRDEWEYRAIHRDYEIPDDEETE
ncbi:MAG: hypothetical protein JSV44_06200 [Candidatus Zixiibacteriota bacterium]|nr:MAG: hypothetical protein JSV44_06200 [candidate division Zixibacteria bacterium]